MEGWFMKNLDKANKWLQRAKSNMARAKSGGVSPDIRYEDLRKAIEIAKKVLKWVKKEMDKGQRPPDPQKSVFE